jgi:GDP-L-fucose synthase
MKYLITGSRGFLGRFLCKRLKEEGHAITEIHSSNCNLCDSRSLEQYDAISFDQIFHLASWTQAGDFCLFHPGEQWIINQKINTNVLAWWQEKQPQAKMVCIGTSCAYDPDLPLKEEFYLQGKPIDSLLTYGMAKRMLLIGLMALHKQYGLEYLYLIPSTLYGPDYHDDGRQMHFIFDLVRKILRGKFYQEQVELWGDGEQKRELIHVRDFVDAMLVLNRTEKNTLINIGIGEEYSIKEFARKICERVEYHFESIHYDRDKFVGARSKVLSIARLKALLPSFPFIDIEKGIAEIIDWMLETHFKQNNPKKR